MPHLTRGWLRYGAVVGLALATLLCSPYGTAQRPAEVDLQTLPADVALLADAPAFDLQTVGLDLRRAAQTTPILRQFQRELARSRSADTQLFAGLNLLTPADQALYRQALSAAAAADKPRMETVLRQTRDSLLKPHVEAAYWLNPGVKPDAALLQAWLRQNRTLPVANLVYARAATVLGRAAAALPKPQCPPMAHGDLDENGRTLGLTTPPPGTDAESHEAALDMAQAYFSGDVSVAQPSDSLAAAPLASWIAGLQAWRTGDYAGAAAAFARVALADNLAGADRAAAAFWQARAAQKLGDPATAQSALRQAAAYPRSFYGQLAQARLGSKSAYRWAAPQLTRAGLAAIAATPNGKRGLALLSIGANAFAEQELRRVTPRGTVALALAAVAQEAKLPMLSLQLGSRVKNTDGHLLDSALFPLPPWPVANADTALVYAVMRHESGFDPATISKAGARGLMQLMPETARYVAPDLASDQIADPVTNVALGSRYLDYLAAQPKIADNLLLQLAAYNGGPGAILRWQSASDAADDPLLFIETLPARETRHYVQNVLGSYWAYQARLGIRATSLQQLAQGQWPRRAIAVAPGQPVTATPLRLASN